MNRRTLLGRTLGAAAALAGGPALARSLSLAAAAAPASLTPAALASAAPRFDPQHEVWKKIYTHQVYRPRNLVL